MMDDENEPQDAPEVTSEGAAARMQTIDVGPVLKKNELLAAVVARSGAKKKDVKPIVEALLVEIGLALHEGREISLNPMGKLKPQRGKDVKGGRVFVARVRSNAPES